MFSSKISHSPFQRPEDDNASVYGGISRAATSARLMDNGFASLAVATLPNFASALGANEPAWPLSSSPCARLLLMSAPSLSSFAGQGLVDHAQKLARASGLAASESSTRTNNGAPLRNDFYDGFGNGVANASALPPPLPDGMDEEEAYERNDDGDDHQRAQLQNLQDLLESAGHKVALWPEGTSSPVNSNDLLAFDIVLVQSRRNTTDASHEEVSSDESVAFYRFLHSAASEAGACLLVIAGDERGSAAAARHAVQMLEIGVDGVLDSAAPSYEVAASLCALAHLARLRRELQVTREQLRLQLQNDDLTNLLNRRFFFQAAHREYERARRTETELSCVMVDVNHFRQMGENFGFACCDASLREIACLLRGLAREGDVVARFGEAKFVVLLPDTPLIQATQLGEAIQREVSSHSFAWNGQALPLSVSIGEAACSFHHSSADNLEVHLDETSFSTETLPEREPLSAREEIAALLEEADAALFVAKRGVRSVASSDSAHAVRVTANASRIEYSIVG